VKAHEADWLRYAWGVVACGREHVERCEAAGGVGMPGDAIARFPGFVGPDFEPGRGVLCMAHIHRYLPDVDDGEGGSLRGVEAAIVGWRQRGRSPESDATFLSESRPAYLSAVSGWRWWKKNYQPMLDEARVPIGEVAFANFAKCRTVTDVDSGASTRLARLCAKAYPPAALIGLLRPAAVLLASLQLDVGDVDVPVIPWNGRNGVDANGVRMANWLPLEAGRLRRIRG
jgi:hypothetical protein